MRVGWKLGTYEGTKAMSLDVHRAVAVNTSRKPRKFNSRVQVERVDPLVMARAFELANGDARRVRAIDAHTVIIRN